MQIRRPIVAGQFYPDSQQECHDQINQFISSFAANEQLPAKIAAGIVPHAGWVFSGRTAALLFWSIKQKHRDVDTFVIFGTTHGYYGSQPAVYNRGLWETPLGEISIDEELAVDVLAAGPAVHDCNAHRTEHSIEVHIPIIQKLFPSAKILPILTPPEEQSLTLGRNIGGIISRQGRKKIICVGSTDLTHYGPRYGFTPKGLGPKAIQWAAQVNDRRFIDLAVGLESKALLDGAVQNCYACGPGAAAASIACAKVLGVEKGLLLEYTNSNDIMFRQFKSTGADSVGYASIIF
jgi:MEMO1 family protein